MVDTWWQTENGHILITPLPGVTTLKPGSAPSRFPGVEPPFDEQGNEIGPGRRAGTWCSRSPGRA